MLIKFRTITVVILVILFSSNVFARADRFVVYHYTKGYLELYKGDFILASKDLWQVFPYVVDADFYNELSDLLVYSGKYIEAEEVLRKAVNIYPSKKEFYYKLFDIYTIEGKKKKALEIMAKIKDRFKYNIDTLKKLAVMYMKSSDYRKAYELLEKYLKKKKNDPLAHFYLANVCLNLNRNRCALDEAERAYNLSLKSPRFGIFLAVLYDKFGYFSNAIRVYRNLPQSSSVMYAIGNDYYLLGDLNNAEKFYYKAFNTSKRIDYFEKLMFVKVKLKKYDDIIKLCSEYKSFVADSDRLKLFCAIALSGKSRCRDALNELSSINKKVDFYRDVIFNKMYCYFKENRFSEIKKLLSESNNLKLYFIVVGSFYMKNDDYNGAVGLLKDALKKARSLKDKASIYMYIADIYYENLHNKNDAIRTLNKLLSLDPNNAEALNYLGYLYIDENINVREGIKLVKKALEIDKNNPYYLDSLGWGYFKLKEYDKSILYLKKALDFYKKTDKKAVLTTLNHLLDVYKRINNYKEARKTAEEILQMDPYNSKAKAFLKNR